MVGGKEACCPGYRRSSPDDAHLRIMPYISLFGQLSLPKMSGHTFCMIHCMIYGEIMTREFFGGKNAEFCGKEKRFNGVEL
jgi:hypothetical protein